MTTIRRLGYRIRGRYKQGIVLCFKLLILIGLSFVVLFPLVCSLTSTFMSETDLVDPTVQLVPKHPTLVNYQTVIHHLDYVSAFLHSLLLSTMVALCTTLSASLVGYSLAKFRFRGHMLLFLVVILSIVIPPQTIMLSLFTRFRYFDIYGILELLIGQTVSMMNTYWPSFLLAITGFGFRGGLFTLLMWQFYRGVPHELLEAAYVDGSGVYKTYLHIVFPLGRSLCITVFLLSFSWNWTDTFYANIFFPGMDIVAKLVSKATAIQSLGYGGGTLTSGMMINTATILVLLPLLVVFLCGQRFMVEGVERSGLVG